MVVGANTLATAQPATVTPSISNTVIGSLPFATSAASAMSVGPTVALAGTLKVIETQVNGWDSVTNELDADQGLADEKDAEIKLRRELQLSSAGNGTIDAIRAKLLQDVNITAATVYHNKKDFIVDGIPPHSVYAIVEGATNQAVGEILFKAVGGGINTHGAIEVIVVDSQGFDQPINFDRPTPALIYLEVDLTVTDEFPANGEDLVLAEILSFGANLAPGADVIVYPKLIRIFDNPNFPGIEDIEIRISKIPGPVSDDNVSISVSEKSDWDSSRITINKTVI
jgi:hypothetical protein